MVMRNAFADLSTQDTQELVAYLLSAILEKMPRTDAADRVVAQLSESTNSVTVASGTITTVTNAANINNFAGGNTALVPFWLSSPGAQHLYNQLEFS